MTTKKITVNANNIIEGKKFYHPTFTLTTGSVYASKDLVPTVDCDTFTNIPGNCKNCGAPVVIYREKKKNA